MSQNITAIALNTALPSSPYEKALLALQIYLRVESATAVGILGLASEQYEATKVFHLVATYFPRVINYHLAMFQSGQKLHRTTENGNYKHLLNAHPSSCVSFYDSETPVVCFEFSSEFRSFYENVFFNIIENKLDILLFNIQALHEQIGIANFQNLFELIKPLNETGIKELLDFSWHCKAHCLSEALDEKNATAIYSFRAKNIPADIQTAIANQPEFPARLLAANDALKNVLLVSKENRSEIINHSVFENLKLIPKIAEVLRKKAVLLKLAPGGYSSSPLSFKIGLIYGSIPDDPANEFFWARRILLDVFNDKIKDLMVTDALIDRVVKKLPAIRCLHYHNCIDIVSQDHNIQEYLRGLEALSFGLPLPPLQLRNTPVLPSTTGDGFHALNAVGVIGVSFAVGVSIYVVNSLCRQYGFWSKTCFGRNKAEENKSVLITTAYKTLKQ
ncbi:MAG: hypothetical protein V4501_09990 [Pseudomonadota bacterium]